MQTAQAAHELIRRDGGAQVEYGSGEAQSSLEVEKICRIRRGVGYFGVGRVLGLDDMIESLGARDRPVYLIYMRLQRALISIWLEEGGFEVAALLLIQAPE